MELQSLLGRLDDGAFSFEIATDPEADVTDLAFLSPQAPISPSTLYFGDSTMLPASLAEDVLFNVVIYGAGEPPAGLLDRGEVNLVRLDVGADPLESYNRLQGCFLEDQRLTATVRVMLQAHFSNNGLQHLVEEASRALGRPIVVVDSSYRYIASCLETLPEGSQAAQTLREEMSYSSVLEEGVAYIRKERIDDRLARQHGPYLQRNAHLGCQTATGAVMVHGICIAHVMMLAPEGAFSELDIECFGRLVEFVGQELQKTSLYETNKGQMDSYFLLSLLADEQPSAAVIERRLRVLNYHPKPTLYIACLRGSRPQPMDAFELDHIAAQLRPALAHDIWCKHEDELVILMNRDEGEAPGPYVESVLADVAELNDLTVGISSPFASLAECRRFYGQAEAAIDYGRKIEHALTEGRVHHYADYAYVQMLDIASQSRNLMDFCHPALLKLLHYDEKHGTELVETLFCYLQNAGSTSRASKMLSLHKNTLLYRLGRIKEISGIDLTSGEEVFLAQISLRVLLFEGLFVPRLQNVRDEMRDHDARS